MFVDNKQGWVCKYGFQSEVSPLHKFLLDEGAEFTIICECRNCDHDRRSEAAKEGWKTRRKNLEVA
jgi:hypothetical protein